MAEFCKTCSQKIGPRALKVSCTACNRLFHAACEGMSKEDVEHVSSSDYVWRCRPCQRVHRQSMTLDQAVNSSKTLDDVIRLLETLQGNITELRKEQREMERSLGDSINECYSRIAEVKEDVRKSAEVLGEQVKCLTAENEQLKVKVSSLEHRLDECEQYSRRNSLEVFGVPEVPNENILQTIKQVGDSIGVTIDPSMVDACHRLPKNSKDPRPRGIVVKFVRRFDKEEVLRRKKMKKTLTARDVGFASDSPIYVNESLTPARRRLMAAARDARKTAGYKYLWTFNGKILLRKEDNGPVTVISDMEDIKKIK